MSDTQPKPTFDRMKYEAEIDRLTALHRAAVEVIAERCLAIGRDVNGNYLVYIGTSIIATRDTYDGADAFAIEYAESLIRARV